MAQQRVPQQVGRRVAAGGSYSAGRCAKQAEREDRAAVGIDAAGRREHAGLGLDAAALERFERRAGGAETGDADEVATQRKQAAHERVRVHVLMTARVDQRDQARLRRQCELVVQRQRGRAADGPRRLRHASEVTLGNSEGCAVDHAAAVDAAAPCQPGVCTKRLPSMVFTSSAFTRPARQASHSRQATAAPSSNINSPSRRGC